MKNILIGLIVGGILGVSAGFAVGIFAFPYIFPPPELNETVTGKQKDDVLATATFIHADPSDAIHFGMGKATVYEDLLHLEEDFRVGPGPKYHVYLVPQANITPDTRVQDTMYVDLGQLKAFSGSQNYVIPAGIKLSEYKSVIVWCEQFNVLISPANLHIIQP